MFILLASFGVECLNCQPTVFGVVTDKVDFLDRLLFLAKFACPLGIVLFDDITIESVAIEALEYLNLLYHDLLFKVLSNLFQTAPDRKEVVDISKFVLNLSLLRAHTARAQAKMNEVMS